MSLTELENMASEPAEQYIMMTKGTSTLNKAFTMAALRVCKGKITKLQGMMKLKLEGHKMKKIKW